MSTQVDLARIVLLNRTVRELLAANPVLLSGEAAVADVGTVRPDLRFGDGVRPWSALPSFKAGGIGGGYFAPFEVQNTINGHPLFRVNDIPGLGPGEAISVFGPGEAAGDIGLTTLMVNGAVNGYVLQVDGATHTRPNIYVASFSAPPTKGMSNGVWIAAGTNSGDSCFQLENAASAYDPANKQQFMIVRGDGSGALGPEPNQLVWDAQGNFNLTGTATLPGRTMSELTDVSIANPRLGDVLQWNGTAWGNVSHLDGYVTLINTGVGLRGGPITATGTIALEDTMVAAGYYANANIVVDQQGRITWAQNGNNELTGLADVELTDPAEGQALTWDGTHWINSTPANALETLTDVDIVDKAQGEVLSWNEQTNKWTNSPLPGGSVIALETLQDVDITDPEPGQVLTWDGSNWVNEKGGGGASVTVATTPPADPESGWLWWDAVSGQLFVWYDDGTSAQWVIANSDEGGGGGGGTPGGGDGGGATALAQLTDVSVSSPAAGQLLAYDAGTQRWVNGAAITLNTYLTANATMSINGQMNFNGVNAKLNLVSGAQITGLSVPIAFTLPRVNSGQVVVAANIAITMPLTIPAQLTGTKGACETPCTVGSASFNLFKLTLVSGAWQSTQIGQIIFNPNSLVPNVIGGTGASLAAGDVLQLTHQVGGTMTNVGITIQAARA